MSKLKIFPKITDYREQYNDKCNVGEAIQIFSEYNNIEEVKEYSDFYVIAYNKTDKEEAGK